MTQDSRANDERDRVVIEEPEKQNLLGLLMSNLLKANMADDAVYRKVRSLEGNIEVQAGEMQVTLRFAKGTLIIVSGGAESAKARVHGDMAAFVDVVRGRGLVSPVLSGAIRISGNPFTLLKLLPLMKAPAEASTDE